MEKKSTDRWRRLWITAGFLTVIVMTVILMSPYGTKPGSDYKLIRTEITIDAPTEVVFEYLGNSANASRWSTFVDHIIPTNPEQFRDGEPGSTRRCFCKPDRTGMRWDELITEVVPNRKRQLTIYNLKEFPMTADGLATEQIYQPLGPETTRLAFTLFFKDHLPTLFEKVKMYIAAYRVASIYKSNLGNIKQLAEAEYRSRQP